MRQRRAARSGAAAAGLMLASMLCACEQSTGGSTAPAPVVARTDPALVGALPLGDVAGAARNTTARSMANPYEGSAQAVQQGHDLFVKMNCAGCHGYGATGGMGPDLTDTYWRYGGVPADVYKSIHEGRPQGMPAWSPALPSDDVWKLVAYIESLGGTFPAADYQASLQGDRPGDNVAPEVQATLSIAAAAPASAASAGANVSPPPLPPDVGDKR